MLVLAPGEQMTISRSTSDPDLFDVTYHRPNTMDTARHLAGAGRQRVSKWDSPAQAQREAISEAVRTANKDGM